MTEDQGLQRQRITAKAPVEDYPQCVRRQLGQHPHPQPQQGPRPRLLQMEVLLERVNHRLQGLSDPLEQAIQGRGVLGLLVATLGGEEEVASPLLPVRLPLLSEEALIAQGYQAPRGIQDRLHRLPLVGVSGDEVEVGDHAVQRGQQGPLEASVDSFLRAQ